MTGNPVIEGKTATFIWQGRTAPRLVDDIHNWEEDPQTMQRIAPGLWSFSMRLVSDAYIEYGFLDPKDGARIADPLNHKRVENGVNEYNHFFYMPRGEPTPLLVRKPRVPGGKLARYQVPTREYVVGPQRSVILYQPPVKEPVPLMVVYDGVDFLKRANLNVIVDNLIAQKRVRPFAIAMIKDGGLARNLEYACSDSTIGFVLDCVIPLAKENLTLTPPGKGNYAIMGASMGGLMALYTGMRLPKLFGKVVSQSGAFMFSEPEPVVVDLVRHDGPADLDIWMDAGRYEPLLKNNRQLYALLTRKNYKAKYHEFSGGHNYSSWRNDIRLGLENLFR